MIIYNVTIHLEESIENDWVNWMQNIHLHDVMNTGMFMRYEFSKMLTRQPDETGVTYVVQYVAQDMAHYERYRDEFAPALQQDGRTRFGEKFMAFRTLMETLTHES
ncbi:MAG: DUF4286 family protein [Bacteroidota bacterium]|jgi:hypothetical protein